MNKREIGHLLLSDQQRITAALALGADRDWLRFEMLLLLRERGLQAVRDVPFQVPNAAWRLDLVARDQAGTYAVELEVEGDGDADTGRQLMVEVIHDRACLSLYPKPSPGARWVVAVAHSAGAIRAMQEFAWVAVNNATFETGGGLAVLVVTV